MTPPAPADAARARAPRRATGRGLAVAALWLAATATAQPAAAPGDAPPALRDGGVAQGARALLERYDCHYCHSERDEKAGPAYADIAAKHRGDPKAVAAVMAVIRKGRHGGAPWPMPPLPQVPEDDARRMAVYILSLGP